jgi:hypothetical protein
LDVAAVHDRRKQKADVVKDPQGLNHVGLLVNEPPGRAGLLFA